MRSLFRRNRSSSLRNQRVPERAVSQRGLRVESLERRQLLAAEILQITIENLSDDTGLANTPVWIAAHDGTFDIGDLDAPASGFAGLEMLAEEGDVSALMSRFDSDGVGNDGVILAPAGFAGAPVFEAGESVTENFTVDETKDSQFFSFAAMVIPSNDAFIGNLNAQAFRIFDTSGNFLGPQTIVVYGSQIWDAGTEVNDPIGGAAFATAGGTSADENGVVRQHIGLDDFVSAGLPTGETLGKAFAANTPIARITIAQASNPSSPIDATAPLAALDADDLNSRADFHEISVIYSDPSGIDLTSITTGDLRITSPFLTQLNILSVTTDAAPGTTPREVVATYRFAPASGSFTALDNGTYSVVLQGNEVNDPFAHAVLGQSLGQFTVDAPVRLNVTFENLADIGGVALTPVFIGTHDGNFEIARAGNSASDFGGLELIAEEGNASELVARFDAETDGNRAVILAPDGFGGAPVFEPGETVTQTLDVFDAQQNRFFSYASMLIPSNDAFIANLDPRAIELFDLAGHFTGSRSITVYGRNVWDAGTEVNAVGGGAAFSTEGGTSADESGLIRKHRGIDEFVGSGIPTGTLQTAFGELTPIGRITISLTDVPADPIDQQAPTATADVVDLTVPGQTVHEVSVTYRDATGIDVSSIDVNDIRVVGLQNETLSVVGVTTDVSVGQHARTVTATYQVTPLDGEAFSTLDNGLYSINLLDGQVGDALGNEVATASLGSLQVLVPVQLRITVENLSPDGGLVQTPFWVGVHEGNFQLARAGALAADFGGLEDLAEEGDVSGVRGRFAAESGGVDTAVLAPGGFAGAPVFESGETGSQTLSVLDTNINRYFSFASMLIPSNDAFFANLNSRAYELFDENGFFLGQRTITVSGRDVWDAGTEVNAVGGGAAFSTEGGSGADENGVIRRHTGLDDFIGSGLPTGGVLASAFSTQTPLARITISLADGTSLPLDNDGPVAIAEADDVIVAGAATHDIRVTYNDPSGIDPTTIGTTDLVVTGPLGRLLKVTGAVSDAAAGTTPSTVTATYTVATEDDQFTARDNGWYVVDVVPNEVRDTLGQSSESLAAGDLRVNVGVRLQIEIESLTVTGGLAQTPFFVGLHDGGFEIARGGVAASAFGGLELLAEDGDASELLARFDAESDGTGTLITAPGGFAGAPVFEPGEVVSQVIEIEGSQDNRYFSFASMAIPSNDAFLANLNSRQYELFDSLGNFHGARQITLYGRDILDAGTEVNDPLGGAAYSTGGGVSVDEAGVIRAHAGLDDFVGTGVPTGTLASAFAGMTPIATITVSLFDPEADICSGVDGACSVRNVSLQNSQLTGDVNGDGNVTPLDALLVVNFLSRFGSQSTIADEAQATGYDLDVGGDHEVTVRDALLVINDITRQLNDQRRQPEGESIQNTDAAFSQLSDGGLFERQDDDERVFDTPGGLF